MPLDLGDESAVRRRRLSDAERQGGAVLRALRGPGSRPAARAIPNRRRRRRDVGEPAEALDAGDRRVAPLRVEQPGQPAGAAQDAGPPFVEIHPDDAAARGIATATTWSSRTAAAVCAARGRDRRRAARRGGLAEGSLGEAQRRPQRQLDDARTRWATSPGRARSTRIGSGFVKFMRGVSRN